MKGTHFTQCDTDSLDIDAIVGFDACILVNTGPDASDTRPDVAIGASVTSNESGGGERLRQRINRTPDAMAMTIPPTTPPAIAGAFDLRENEEGLDDVGVEDGGKGLRGENEKGAHY